MNAVWEAGDDEGDEEFLVALQLDSVVGVGSARPLPLHVRQEMCALGGACVHVESPSDDKDRRMLVWVWVGIWVRTPTLLQNDARKPPIGRRGRGSVFMCRSVWGCTTVPSAIKACFLSDARACVSLLLSQARTP